MKKKIDPCFDVCTRGNQAQVYEKVVRIISDEIGIRPADITPDLYLRRDLMADREEVLNLEVALEDEFGIEFPYESLWRQIPSWGRITVRDIVWFIANELAKKELVS
ncbi:MAG: hypothetical protein HYV53_04940 [Parcubacteria group bacterium]|nr:hypothetical protein [Parcubacteria group bacterium]